MDGQRHDLVKDPAAKLVYGRDWSGWLASDLVPAGTTLTASSWSATPDDAADEGGLKLSGGDFRPTGATSVWAAGGKAGTAYRVANRIEAGAFVDERSFTLYVEER